MRKRLLSREEAQKLKSLEGKAREFYKRHLRSEMQRRKYSGAWRKPAQPMSIAGSRERDSAFRKGKMVFYTRIGRKKTRLAFDINKMAEPNREPYRLVMPVTVDKKMFTIRFNPEFEALSLFEVRGGVEMEITPYQFVTCDANDMGHLIMTDFEKRNIILPIMRIATEHAIAENGSAVAQGVFLTRFAELFSKLGYSVTKRETMHGDTMIRILDAGEIMKKDKGNYQKAGIMEEFWTMVKTGERNAAKSLHKNYRFVGINPETGRTESFYYPIS